ncbi:histidine kinase N-terminal domain-containing protein [Bacillus sp. Marseille-P3661]|uniref:histidine kinase N-terminal domain-containing protein n=1 Tax=Bacillus sp. Marseille-P3661 TaxID=1936234 RepID=UPI000C84A323|nr:histidine kinase N-terminal domain-containing protein [Bacillus sp. Marseille-P3661]
MLTIEEKISIFIDEHINDFVDGWKDQILTSDPEFQETIINYGITMYHIMKDYICSSTPTKQEVDLKKFANNVAKELVSTNKELGSLVYNVNLSRTEVFKHLSNLNISIEELQESINKINTCFDQFLYYAVCEYTTLMNAIIEEKNRFIAQSHKDRLTILGQMTSSFVHECKNPLTAVIGFIQLLKSEYPTLPYISVLQRELDQLNSRISQFLLLSKNKTNKNVESFLMTDLIEETKDFIYPRTVDKGIDLVVSAEGMEYTGYRDELKQVLVNIIFNSIEALDQSKELRKQITVSLTKSIDKIFIHISNNGPKIPDESLASIFEPFVTTKNTGTGLGLFVCKQIIEKHSGHLHCRSNDEMTTFTIELPELKS